MIELKWGDVERVIQRDAYDAAVDHFLAHPEEGMDSWGTPVLYRYGYLFSYLDLLRSGLKCGCPSMVRWNGYRAEKEELTAVIREMSFPDLMERDEWTPTREELESFATAQRLADRMLGREPPAFPEEES